MIQNIWPHKTMVKECQHEEIGGQKGAHHVDIPIGPIRGVSINGSVLIGPWRDW